MKKRRWMMKSNLFAIFTDGFEANHFIRIGENNKINLYIGKDEYGRYSFDFRGSFRVSRTSGSEVIQVSHIDCGNEKFLRFSLCNNDLLECFCTFCEDLVDSTLVITDDQIAYETLRSRYFLWKKLFKPNHGNLTELEIIGLLGELLFLKDYLIPQKGTVAALDSWTGPEKTHKDFSYDNEWYEIKAIHYGKESVHISSIEQLDSSIDGNLVVYAFEKMSPSFNGIKLNSLVNELISVFNSIDLKDVFLAKLSLYGFEYSLEYDNYVYDLKSVSIYRVDNMEFPRVVRSQLPESIIKVQYEILLSEIERFKK